MLRILCLITIIAVALADAGKSITASVKDTAVNGVEGLNIKWSAPFKFQDYVVGFRTTLGDLRRAPEELFAKRSFNTGGDSTATVDADYNIESKRLNLNAKWSNEKIDLGAEGNSEDKLTSLSASTNTQLNGNNLNVGAVYDMMKRRITGSSELEVDDTKVSLEYDNDAKNPVLSVSHKLDDRNTVEPTISLKSGDMTYGWTRKINGGELNTRLHPGDRVDVTWEDRGANGIWSTRAEVPLENTANTKISFSRDWAY
jgi:hypothetical protein